MVMRTHLAAAALAALLVAPAAAQAATGYATATVNLRAGPGVEFARLGTIPGGDRLVVQGCLSNWCRASYAGRTGWVARSYVSFTFIGGPGGSNGPNVLVAIINQTQVQIGPNRFLVKSHQGASSASRISPVHVSSD
jgi:uncharacterized protein YraI